MGKRKRRLHSPKYAKKYASVRESYNRLRGVVKESESDCIITEEEDTQIKAAKEEVVEAIIESAVEEVTEVIEKVIKTTEPKAKKVQKKKTPSRPRTVKRTSKTKKTAG